MTLRRLVLLLPCLLAVAAIVPRPVAAQGVVADLSDHLIAITTAFSGTDVLLFGALDEAGTDVAVVVRGPETDEIVRHKTRVGPIWLNTGEMTFAKAPSYYAVASSKPLEELADPGELRRHGIGTHNLGFERMASPRASPGEVRPFVDALIRNKQREALYTSHAVPIRFIGPRLFRTTLSFPANVRPGQYEVQVFEVRDRAVVSAQHNALLVSKIGVEADIYDAAHRHPALYGLASVVLAIVAGWAASVMFKK